MNKGTKSTVAPKKDITPMPHAMLKVCGHTYRQTGQTD